MGSENDKVTRSRPNPRAGNRWKARTSRPLLNGHLGRNLVATCSQFPANADMIRFDLWFRPRGIARMTAQCMKRQQSTVSVAARVARGSKKRSAGLSREIPAWEA